MRSFKLNKGASLVEYGMVVGLVSVAAIVAVTQLGNEVSETLGSSTQAITDATRTEVIANADGTCTLGLARPETYAMDGTEINGCFDGYRGNDNITGTSGEDLIFGGDGNDSINGLNNTDEIRGGRGDDYLTKVSGQGRYYGDEGNDIIHDQTTSGLVAFGGPGNDTITSAHGGFVSGGTGNDVITTDEGADDIEGGDGDDNIRTGQGRDRIDGGRGNDRLDGGSGPDVFVFQDGDGNDQIINFRFGTNSQDRIDLQGVTDIVDYTDLIDNHLTISGNTGTITYGDGNTIYFSKDIELIDPANFIFS
jgi:Ca2+-binding RTX toxin-like protein